MKDWKVVVKYKDEAPTEHIVRGGEEMTRQDVAKALQEKLLGKNVLWVDTPRDEKEPTVYRLAHYGYVIESFEEIKE